MFSLLGTVYGGDGRTTFALPDLRSRVPVHSGDGNAGPGLHAYQLGERGGQEDVALSQNEIPSHSHVATVKAFSGGRGGNPSTSPAGNYLSEGGSYNSSKDVQMAVDAVTVGATGGGQAHSNVQPYLGINFIIALEGVYPPRS